MTKSKHDKSHSGAVHVRGNNVDQALKVLRRKMQQEGVFREMKLRQFFEPAHAERKRVTEGQERRARKTQMANDAKNAGMSVKAYKVELKRRNFSPR